MFILLHTPVLNRTDFGTAKVGYLILIIKGLAEDF